MSCEKVSHPVTVLGSRSFGRARRTLLFQDRAESEGESVAVYITARHMEGGDEHQHISAVKWINRDSSQSGASNTAQMVEWIERGGDARVDKGPSFVKVGVVKASTPYIRTFADGEWSDDLLALPTY